MSSSPIGSNVRWLQHSESGCDPRVGLLDDDTVLIEWPDFARMRVRGDQDEAEIEWLATAAGGAARKFERGAGRTLPRYMRGSLVLHASAIAIDGRALALLGDAGAGKSTTAAILCQRGAKLLSDDSTVVTRGAAGFAVEPVEARAHWLRRDAVTSLGFAADADEEKSEVAAASAREPTKLAAVALLVPSDSRPAASQMRGTNSLQPLVSHSLRLPLGAERLRHDFDAILDVASTVPIFRVLRPTAFSATFIDELADALLKLVSG